MPRVRVQDCFSDKIEALRKKYRPDKHEPKSEVVVVFVGESPPRQAVPCSAHESKLDFFYNPRVSGNELRAFMKCTLEKENLVDGTESDADFLHEFAAKGFYLIDAVKAPLDKRGGSHTLRSVANRYQEALLSEIAGLHPEIILTLGKIALRSVTGGICERVADYHGRQLEDKKLEESPIGHKLDSHRSRLVISLFPTSRNLRYCRKQDDLQTAFRTLHSLLHGSEG